MDPCLRELSRRKEDNKERASVAQKERLKETGRRIQSLRPAYVRY